MAAIRGNDSQKVFADKMRIHKNTWARYERGERMPDAEILLTLSEYGYNPEWILTGKGPRRSFDNEDRAPGTKDSCGAYHIDGDFALVPRYDVQASAGHGSVVENENIIDYLAFRKDWIRKSLGASPSDLAIISARGDSMHPTISDGDTLLVNLKESSITRPGIYVVHLGQGLVAKRCEELPGGHITLKSDNNLYPAMGVPPEERDSLKIVGRVVWIGHKA